jgi:hypothetical protein
MRRALALGVLALVTPRVAAAANGTTPGAVTAPYPTLENIALEWALTGDDNANATATVRYRKLGAASFRSALPLFRVPAGNNQGFSWDNKLAGSIFGLEPGTEYEIELELGDPDGGNASEMLTVKTRPLPVAPANARSVPVVPDSLAAALDAAAPGDVLLLADGSYEAFVVPNDGTEAAPIVIRAASAGKAVVEGDVRLDGRAHVFLEDLAVHGKIKMNDADSVVVRGCTIETPDYGIIAYGNGITNAVIMNNVVTGTTVWREASLGTDGDNNGEGIQFTGPGNVVAYNRVSGFRDCLSLMEDDEAVAQIADDFYGNDLSACADDAVEADFAMGNVRVYGNRIRDSFMGISSQPGLGGPTYFVRNAMYNVLFQAFKLQRSSVGDVGFHNTVVKSGDAFSVNTEDVFSRATFRNNLFIGGPCDTYNGYDSGPGDIMMLPSADLSCSFDYDGYGSIGTAKFAGRVGDVRFDGLDELHSLTSEAHGLEVDLSVFAANVTFPANPFAAPATPSLLLASDGSAIDQGVPLANVNDDFTGAAPDLGAFELGTNEPVYGPGGDVSGPDGDSAGAGGQTAAENGGSSGTTSAGNGGTSSNRGGTSAGGTATGGTATAAHAGEAGTGAANAGGTAGAAAGSTSTATGGDGASSSSDADSGCGCAVPRRSSHAASTVALALGLALSRLRRRARPSPHRD